VTHSIPDLFPENVHEISSSLFASSSPALASNAQVQRARATAPDDERAPVARAPLQPRVRRPPRANRMLG